MSRLATVTMALSLFASVALAAPPQGAKPKTDAKPAKVQGHTGARKEQKKTPPITTRKVGAKKAKVREEQGAHPAVRADSAGTPGRKAPAAGTTPGKKLDRKEMAHKLMVEERKHRERLARIARLRELAAHKNQTERIAALDELLAKENARHARWVEEGRQVLGEKGFADVEGKLRRGRRPSHQKGTGRVPAKEAGTPVRKVRDEAGSREQAEKEQVKKERAKMGGR